MKEQTLVEMQRKIDALVNITQKLIKEVQQVDTLSRGTITALQVSLGEKKWNKVVEELKVIEDKQNEKSTEKKLDLNVE